ncbi:MAG: twin-arginine translocase subunit TatC [Omnitrophica WOR_2 bacterium]
MAPFAKRLGYLFSSPYRWTKKAVQNTKDFFNEEPEDTPLPDVVTKTVSDIEGVFYHIDALRARLLYSVIFLLITTAFSFTFTKQILTLLTQPIGGMDKLVAIDVTESVGVYMRVALLSGFALALPFIVFQLWLFVAPGLKKNERIFSLITIPAIAFLFIGGMAFAYFIMMPTALQFLLNFMFKTIPRPSTYISFVTSLLFWIGIAFEFPVVVYILAAIGIVKAKFLANQWRIAVVIIAVVAAAITPTVDPISMSLVMGPMVVLYFLSVGLAYFAQRGRSDT